MTLVSTLCVHRVGRLLLLHWNRHGQKAVLFIKQCQVRNTVYSGTLVYIIVAQFINVCITIFLFFINYLIIFINFNLA